MPKLLLFFLLWICFHSVLSAQDPKGSVENELLHLTGKEKVKRLLLLSDEFYRRKEYGKSIRYAKQALEYLPEAPDEIRKAELLENIGKALYKQNLYTRALGYFLEALPIWEKEGDAKDKSIIYYRIGRVYYKFSDYKRALEFFLKSLSMDEKIGDKESQADSLNNIGSIYKRLKDYDRAMKYYQRYLAIMKENGDLEGESIAFNNIGVVYLRIQKYDQGMACFNRALEISLGQGDKEGISSAYNNIGLVYDYKKNYPLAQEYYEKTLAVSKEADDKWGITLALINLAEIHRKQDRIQLALSTVNDAMKWAKKIEARVLEADCWEIMAFIYTTLKDHSRADEYYSKFTRIKDDIFNESVSSKIAEMLTQYQTTGMEKEIELLKKDTAIKELQLKKKEMTKTVMLAGVLLLSGLVVLLFYAYRLKARAHKNISKKNRELEEAYRDLEEAHSRIQTLSGLVPICSKCKSVRDDKGFWHRVESYVQKHSKAEFSHSLCPKCTEELYPGLE